MAFDAAWRALKGSNFNGTCAAFLRIRDDTGLSLPSQ